jgi:hypothetical protein
VPDRLFRIAVATLTWVSLVGAEPLLNPWMNDGAPPPARELLDPWSPEQLPADGNGDIEPVMA